MIKLSKKKISLKRSPFILTLLFFLFFFLSPVVAQVTTSVNPIDLLNASRTSVEARNYHEAVEKLQQAASKFADSGDKLNLAVTLSNLSSIYQQQGKWPEAEQAINDSLNILQNLPATPEQQRIQAGSLDIKGKLEKERGQPEKAILTWQQSQEIYSQLPSPKEDYAEAIRQNQIYQAQALQDLGLYPRACETLLEVLNLNLYQIGKSVNLDLTNCQALTVLNNQEVEELIKAFNGQSNDSISSSQVDGLRSLGEVLALIGNLQLSEYFLLQAYEFAQSFNLTETQASIQLSLGNTKLLQGNTEEALEYYRAATNSGDLGIKITSNINQLSLLEKMQFGEELEELEAKIESQIAELPINKTKIYSRIKLAKSLICWKKPESSPTRWQSLSVVSQQCGEKQLNKNFSWDKIEQILQQGLLETETLNNKKAKAYILGYLGAVYQDQQQWIEAEKYTQDALKITSAFYDPEITYNLLWQLGRLRKIQGDYPNSLASYQAAYESLQFLRQDLVTLNPDVQFNFRDSVEPVYREYVDLLLKEETITQDKLKKSLSVIEALQLAELNNFFRDACVEQRPETLDVIVDNTNSETAIIYATVLPEKIEVILKLPQKELKNYPTEIEQYQVEEHLKNLQDYLTDQSRLPNDIQQLSQSVYDWLIRPFANDLAESKVTTLVFVLDGLLRSIPMSVLYDGEKYLIEKYAIAVTPGLRLLASPPNKQIEKTALTGGLTQAIKVENKSFEPLPNVAQELREIKSQIATIEPLLMDENFIKKQLENKVETANFNVLHLATHGQFSSNLEETFILTWDRLLKVREFDKLLRVTSTNKTVPLELLVLSACETAKGDQRATLGLAGIALRAGARSTLASLWAVNDESTSELMRIFYQQLNNTENISKAKALQKAQLAILHHENATKLLWDSPYFWAPFILVGNWQ